MIWCTKRCSNSFALNILKKEKVFIWIQNDCEINWVLFSLLFSLKSRFNPKPIIINKFLHFLLHHFLQSKIWIQKDSGDAWSFLHVFCWNKWKVCLPIFHHFKTFEILYRSLATCSQSHTVRDYEDGSNRKSNLWEFSSQLQGRENDVAFSVTREKMWGKRNIHLKADQCCHKTEQQWIKHRLEECFQPPLRRGCHPLADGLSLSQVFSLQLPRVLFCRLFLLLLYWCQCLGTSAGTPAWGADPGGNWPEKTGWHSFSW